ncbi:MAG: L,D-transpeptidase [Candidatus Magasanikbacteria bacterium]|nr:L,D-transpeptidase [Candidatus Magasanikbacteria bacterium]
MLVPTTVQTVELDSDNDGLSDDEEMKYYTDFLNSDTDGDGFFDGEEVKNGYSPLAGNEVKMSQHDLDTDGLNDWVEGWFGSDRGNVDTDGDGVDDYREVMRGYSPTDASNTKRFKREIQIDLTYQHLYYIVDRKLKMFDFPVSTGNPWTPTPPGEYEILEKIPVKRYVAADYDLPNVKWNMKFIAKGGYYIHGSYWHNLYGKSTASHGCVNMRTEDAGVLYEYVDEGMKVSVVGKTPKGRVVGS